jgi:hypothetical protein
MAVVWKFMQYIEVKDFVGAMWDALLEKCKTKISDYRIPRGQIR